MKKTNWLAMLLAGALVCGIGVGCGENGEDRSDSVYFGTWGFYRAYDETHAEYMELGDEIFPGMLLDEQSMVMVINENGYAAFTTKESETNLDIKPYTWERTDSGLEFFYGSWTGKRPLSGTAVIQDRILRFTTLRSDGSVDFWVDFRYKSSDQTLPFEPPQQQQPEQGGTEQGGAQHTHTFAEEWTSDETSHWHAAMCGHADAVTKESHSFTNGECSVCHYVKIDENTDPDTIVSDKVTEEEWRAALADELIHNFKLGLRKTADGSVYTGVYLFGENSFHISSATNGVVDYELFFQWDSAAGQGDFYGWYGDDEGWEHKTYTFEPNGFPFADSDAGTFFVGELPYLRENFSKATYDEELGGYTFVDTQNEWAAGWKFVVKFKNGRMCALGALDPDDPTNGSVGVTYDYGKLTASDFLPACGHFHTFVEVWTSDENYHWHAAACEHSTEVLEKRRHTYQNGECTVCHYVKVDKDTDLTALVSDKLTEEEWKAAFSEEALENFKVDFQGLVSHPTALVFQNYAFIGKNVLVEMIVQCYGDDEKDDIIAEYKVYMIVVYKEGNYELYQTIDEQGTQWGHDVCSEEQYESMLWDSPSFISEEIRSLKDKFAQVTYDEDLDAYLYTDTDDTHGAYANTTFVLKFKNGRLCAFGIKSDDGSVDFGLVHGYGEAELIPLPTEYVEVDLF